MGHEEDFENTKRETIRLQGQDSSLRKLSLRWFEASYPHKYSYHFTWLGRPVIQYPQDLIALQEIIWRVRPEIIVETGIAHGGSLIFSASMLELIGGDGMVVGVDIDIRAHNKRAIEAHPLAKRITMIQGSSIDPAIVESVRKHVAAKSRVLVILDSNHTHEHVLEELVLYSPFVSKDSYLIVFDTIVEDLPEDASADRPWGPGNNPKTAVREFLKTTKRFTVDRELDDKLLISVAPEGYLRCIE